MTLESDNMATSASAESGGIPPSCDGPHPNTQVPASMRSPTARLSTLIESMEPHHHLGLIYETKQEWRDAVVSFIAIGLRRGQRCLCIMDAGAADETRGYLAEDGIDIASAERTGQLVMLDQKDAHTREGPLEPDQMIALLIEENLKAQAEGCPALRTTVEMSFMLHDSVRLDRLLEYEAKLNRDVFPHHLCIGMCQYDRHRFSPEVIKDAIMMHPLLVYRSHIYRNSYYVPPEEYLNETYAATEVEHWLEHLESDRRQQESLRMSEAKYRSLFEQSCEAIAIVNTKGHIVDANQAWLDLFGYRRADLSALNAENMYARPAERVDFLQRIASSGYVRDEVLLKKKGSTTVLCQRSVLALTDSSSEQAAYEAIIRDVTASRNAEQLLRESHARTERVLQGTLEVIQEMTEARDPYTAGHQKRVAELAVAIARQMGLPEATCISIIEMAALIHDIGKMVVPSEILSKPGALSHAEYQLIKAHPQAGYDILKRAELPGPVPEAVLQHHERLDGSGYPQGLSGDEILPEAQILAVADVVEAMSSHRPYRPALGVETALLEISAGSGKLYYPDVVDACLAVFRERHFAFSR